MAGSIVDQRASGRRRWPLVAGAVVLAVVAGGGAYVYLGDDPTATFCYSTGFLLPNGEIARSGPSCRRLDEDGNLLSSFNDGTPLCYTADEGPDAVTYEVVPCDDSRADERPDGSPL